MVPPTGPLNLDVEAISGICGSISIACWVVVFSPQIIENFRRGSADGLSLQFVIVWLAGDVFNILGAVLQGVLPTMIILAIYYTIADIVLLGQCFYYRGFTWRDEVVPPPKPKPRAKPRVRPSSPSSAARVVNERTTLLPDRGDNHHHRHHNHQHSHDDHGHNHHHHHAAFPRERRGSDWSTLSNLSPAVPFVTAAPPDAVPLTPTSPSAARLRAVASNALAVLMVCAAGVAGWYLSRGYSQGGGGDGSGNGDGDGDGDNDVLAFSLWGQVFGWLCAVLYLGSRLPQLLLNWRRQSTEGVSMLFFLFACLGNLTYVLSIFAFEPRCRSSPPLSTVSPPSASECAPGEAAHIYGQYILVNLSWLAGSLGTLLLDMGIFVQFFLYRRVEDEDDEEDGNGGDLSDGADGDDDEQSIDGERWHPRPVLERNMSSY